MGGGCCASNQASQVNLDPVKRVVIKQKLSIHCQLMIVDCRLKELETENQKEFLITKARYFENTKKNIFASCFRSFEFS
jgi:hypothetical protein